MLFRIRSAKCSLILKIIFIFFGGLLLTFIFSTACVMVSTYCLFQPLSPLNMFYKHVLFQMNLNFCIFLPVFLYFL